MNFANPWALLGLLSIPLIVVMYMFRQKYREVEIPSLFLWREAVLAMEAKKPLQRLRRNLLLFLQILAALLLTLALSRPFAAGAETADYIVILDNSLSMQAADVAPSRFEAAKGEAEKLIARMGANSRASVIVMDSEPYILAAQTTDRQGLLAKVRGLEPSYTAANSELAVDLAKTLYGQSEAAVYLFSDLLWETGELPVKTVVLGESATNTGITMVSHIAEADRVIALVKVRNYSGEPAENSLAVYADDKICEVSDFVLEPWEEKAMFFISLPPSAKKITARLSLGDVLEADDEGYDYVHTDIAKRALLFADKNIFLENVLAVMPNIELYRGDSAEMENLSGYDLYVFDGALPEKLPQDGHILVFNPSVGNGLLETRGEFATGKTELGDSEFLSFIQEMDIAVLKAKEMTVPEWGSAAMRDAATGLPLIVTGEKGNQKIAVFAFDLHNTDYPLKKEFPIFMYHLCEWFAPGNVFAGTKIYAGSPVYLHIAPEVRAVEIVSPDGTGEELAPPFASAVYDHAAKPGFYSLVQTGEKGKSYTGFAVNAGAPGDCDLTRGIAGGIYGADGDLRRVGAMDLTGYAIIALLVLLAVEWKVHCDGN